MSADIANHYFIQFYISSTNQIKISKKVKKKKKYTNVFFYFAETFFVYFLIKLQKLDFLFKI